MPAAARWRVLLPACWAGVLLCLAVVATPAGFALLPQAEAGRLAGRMLAQEAWAGLVLGTVLLALEWRAGRADQPGGGHARVRLAAGFWLALATLACTVGGYFVVQPLMVAARAGQGALGFGTLHAISSVAFALKLLALLALAWRNSGMPAGLRRPTSS